ncbi:MAG: hypothetical protein NUW01_01350 [Gemmatimonadaceae bacterium]|nr:hypothetical protein [Gemmatimonadaceae bacterium]
MVDTVTTRVLRSDSTGYTIRLLNHSDGSGESAVKKVDRSTLTGPSHVEPYGLDVVSIRWAVEGFSYVLVLWDAATDDECAICINNGYENYSDVGGDRDPRSTTNVGDILVTTSGAISGAAYDITLRLRLRGN